MNVQTKLRRTDKEIYKLGTVYYGPIVNIPSYDNAEW